MCEIFRLNRKKKYSLMVQIANIPSDDLLIHRLISNLFEIICLPLANAASNSK